MDSLIAEAKRRFDDVIAMHIPSEVFSAVLSWLKHSGVYGEYLSEIIGAMVPLHAQLTSGFSAVFSAFKAARDAYRQYYLCQHAQFIAPGAPSAAVAALSRLMERSLESNLYSAAVSAAQCATQCVLQALDVTGATPAIVGAAAALASISNRLVQIGRDFLEALRANQKLANPDQIDLQIFNTCPVLGCYLLLGTETSSFVNFLGNVGGPGWMDEVEWLKKEHIDPLREQALIYAKQSRFILVSQTGDAIIPEKARWRTEIERTDKKRKVSDEFKSRIQGYDALGYSASITKQHYSPVWERFHNPRANRPD